MPFCIPFAAVVGVRLALIPAGMPAQVDFSNTAGLTTAVLVASAIVATVIYIPGVSTIYQLVVKMRLRQGRWKRWQLQASFVCGKRRPR
jgi:hypothetical protein